MITSTSKCNGGVKNTWSFINEAHRQLLPDEELRLPRCRPPDATQAAQVSKAFPIDLTHSVLEFN